MDLNRVIITVFMILVLIGGIFNLNSFFMSFIKRVHDDVMERVAPQYPQYTPQQLEAKYRSARWSVFTLGMALIGLFVALAIAVHFGKI